jgi:predicted nucleic acid-binding protein
VDKVFLDANVLFSAAYRSDSRLLDLWSLAETELVTSVFALEEARQNLSAHRPQALACLDRLTEGLTIVEGLLASTPADIELAEKDLPILAAAISASCSHLITGDNRHFGALYGHCIQGVLILTPAQYLKSRA